MNMHTYSLMHHTKHWLSFIALVMLLTGCQSTMQQVADCKTGDWVAIGRKDGHAGLMQNYKERKAFCSSYSKGADKTDTATDYQSGWEQGNWNLWSETGHSDGRAALPTSQLESHAIPKGHAPANHAAYEAGWLTGNTEHWQNMGTRVGSAGLPLAQKETSRSEAARQQIRFDEAAYENGWMTGNRIFWQNAGFEDAHNGIPDSQLVSRAAAARAAGVLVQKEAYQAAWNAEIVNYWRNLGTADAVSGKDFAMRQREAKQKGLKVFETEYKQNWEARLASYWTQVGNEDGYGHPFQLEERIANATHDRVFVIAKTRELYTQAWQTQNARYCNVDDAFNYGRKNQHMAIEVCQPNLQGQLRRALLSGRDYEEIAAKLARVQREISDHTRNITEARSKLAHLDRIARSNAENKQRVINEETNRQDKQREREHHALDEQLDHSEHQLAEARRWEDQYKQQMHKLQRDIYIN